MSGISKAIGVLFIIATIGAGIWVNIVWLLIGGIEEIVRGAEAHPVSGHDVGWGIAHVVLTGVGIWVAAVLCIIWAVLFLGHTRTRRSSRTRRSW